MRLPIRVRLTVIFGLLMAAVLASMSSFLYFRLASNLDTAINHTLETRSRTIVAVMQRNANPLRDQPGLLHSDNEFAQVLDPNGQIVSSSPLLGSKPMLSPTQISHLSSPIRFERQMSTEDDRFTARFQATRTPSGNVVVAGESLEGKTQALTHLRNLLWLGIPTAFAATMALVWLLTGAALRPVDRLRSDATSLSENRPDLRLPVPATGDEIERLALTLNDMLDRLWTSAERERRLVDDASHELRTPLAILQTEIELALRGDRTNDELEGALRSAAEETDRLSRLAEDLLVLARSNRGLLTVAPEPTDVQALVAAVVSERGALAAGAGPRIDIAAVEPAIANVDPVWIRQVLRNLLDNAVRHTPDTGSVEVRVVRDGEAVVVSVSDDGPGFAPDALERVFEPFARADPARTRRSGGAGLGLSIVQAVVVAHGGSVSARNRDIGGAAVEVRLPSSNLMPAAIERKNTHSRH